MDKLELVWEKVSVPLTDYPYDILVGPGILTQVPDDLKKDFPASKYILITDSNVSDVLGQDLLNILVQEGINVDMLVFPAGEASKTMDTVVDLARRMVAAGADRKSIVLALGGGVTGDIAAFLASIYMRGIPCIQLPTSLLAQVDSSVGGKTGVDIPEGKNLLGTFSQPLRVYCDIGTLASLPEGEFRNGLAEVVKYGMIRSPELFSLLEEHTDALLALEPELLCKIVAHSCQIKADVVSQDEKEGGLRRILNFGHTIGHAVEAAADYKIPHGEAVSIGMVAVSRIAVYKGIFSEDNVDRLINLLKRLGLPTAIPAALDTEVLLSLVSHDKKTVSGKTHFVLCPDIGKCLITSDVTGNEIKKAIEESRAG